jgi:molybdenum cofactor synthesis domain-containing protein
MAKKAAFLIIGNEILSGKTQDKNLNYIAKKLGALGIIMAEARVVPDIPAEIIFGINELRKKYDYVFTSGGIGPTHDDITTENVAKAFGVQVIRHPEAKRRLEEYYSNRPETTLNEARLRMADVPEGAVLIDNPITSAPGYKIENVFVFAGIPSIMQVMFDFASQFLEGGKPVVSETVSCNLIEGDIAAPLTEIQAKYNTIDIGSYPFIHQSKYAVSLVARGFDEVAVANAANEIREMIKARKGDFIEPKE